MSVHPLLDMIDSPSDLKRLTVANLRDFADEIRQFMISHLSKTGGHLASNLGVVELTLALHYVFNSPCDKLIWDVGHQTYVHKIITERKELFHSIRQFGGLSGFPKRNESMHDVFETGHSSTSISAALGIARARDIAGSDCRVIAIIGDGSLTGGIAFEGLNDAGHSKTNLIVVLNDNQMCISPNVGALAGHLSRIRSHPKYAWFKKEIEFFIKNIPLFGKFTAKMLERLKNSFKYIFIPGVIFEEMGFTYLGPVDGHNLPALIDMLKRAATVKGPVFVHVVTTKGKGYSAAESNPDIFHSVPPFIVKTGELFGSNAAITYSQVFGQHLISMADKDPRVVAVTAAMTEGTGLIAFKEKFPARFFDVGIAEQHAVTMAAGMASNGLRPYVAVYSTFLQRAYDQVVHDVCIQKLPVRLIIDRAGLAGEDGETHHGMFDISFLRHIPNITIMSPRNTDELKKMLDATLDMDGPVAIRYPKGSEALVDGASDDAGNGLFRLGWEVVLEGLDCCILAFGRMLEISLRAAKILRREGIYVKVVNARVLKPIDEVMLFELAKLTPKWVTVEDSIIQGGFGSSINEFAVQHQCRVSLMNIGMPDRFITHGSVDLLLKQLDLDDSGIALRIKNFLEGLNKNSYVNM